jgi:hypothetical protein
MDARQMDARIDRRTLLGAAAAAGLGAALAPGAGALARTGAAFPARRTQRVVLIAFAGGVRTRETIGSADNAPTLRALAAEGVLYPRARTANLGHYGAALQIFTGVAEQRGIRENARGDDPTVFEYVRKDLALPASDVWLATSGGTQQTNYAYGLHAEFGSAYGASTVDGDGVFNREFRRVLDAWGRPKAESAEQQSALARLRAALARGARGPDADLAARERVERFLLEELTRGTADLSGANAGDAKALRVARNLLALYKPKLLAVALQNADVAHGSYNGYVEVVRRNDAALGEIVKLVREDPELAATTSILVVPEFGRDRDLNARRGLDHGDGSEDLTHVACVAWGPDFRRGAVVNEEVRVVDVAPTVCDLLGARPSRAEGRRLPGLYA